MSGCCKKDTRYLFGNVAPRHELLREEGRHFSSERPPFPLPKLGHLNPLPPRPSPSLLYHQHLPRRARRYYYLFICYFYRNQQSALKIYKHLIQAKPLPWAFHSSPFLIRFPVARSLEKTVIYVFIYLLYLGFSFKERISARLPPPFLLHHLTHSLSELSEPDFSLRAVLRGLHPLSGLGLGSFHHRSGNT